jgi:hypothetical protein
LSRSLLPSDQTGMPARRNRQMPVLHPFVSGAFQRRCGERRFARIGASQSGAAGTSATQTGRREASVSDANIVSLAFGTNALQKLTVPLERRPRQTPMSSRGTWNITKATANPPVRSFARTAEYIQARALWIYSCCFTKFPFGSTSNRDSLPFALTNTS